MTRPRWCQHTKPHRPHRWLLARRVQECPGVVGPPADAAARSGLRPLPVVTAPADEPVSVPPPVDALLKLIAQYGQHTNEEAHGEEDAGFFASGTFRQIEIALDALWASGVAEGRRQATEERTEEQEAVAPIVWLEFVVALPPGNTLLGQAGVQVVLDRLGVTKTGDTAVRGAESTPGDWPAGTSFVAYSMPVSHG